MAISYDGLTRNAWTGTWSTTGDHPIALNNEIRGGIHVVSGSAGDQLADIPGQRLQEGMLVYLQNSYGSFTGSKWYTYNLLVGESRSAITGAVPNADGNWTEFSSGTGGGSGGGGGLAAVVDDTTPELGGNLDVNGFEIVSSSGQNIMLAPDGYLHLGSGGTATHRVGMYDRYFFPNTSPTAGQVLQANASTPFQLEWATPSSGSGGSGFGTADVDAHLNQSNPTAGYVLSWNGTDYAWVAQSSGSGSGATTLGGLTDVSSSTPTAGQVLKWDGTQWAPASDAVSATSGGITLGDLSVTKATAFGNGNLTYNNSTGVFLFTPPDLSGYSTFSGNYADLQGLPTLFSGNYNDLTNTPATSDNIVFGLNNSTLQLINNDDSTVIDSINLNTITPYLSYNDLDDLPSLFSGNYNDLTNKPTIPSLSGYATQTYVQTYVAGLSSDNITEGGTNLYYADERVDDRVAVLIDAGTGLTSTYDDSGNLLTIDLDDTAVTPGQYGTNTQIPVLDIDQQGRITGATTTTISTDLPIAGDTGTDSVSLLTDTLTIAGGTGVDTTVASDTVTIDIGQPVGTTDSVTFDEVTVTNNVSVGGDLSVTGDLTVSGTLTSINTTDTEITDNVLTLNKGETGAGVSLGTSGIEIDRGTEPAVSIVYNDTDDQWTFGTETLETGHILPAAHEIYDLGSSTKAWKDLYLSGNSIFLGGLQISSTTGGTLVLGNGSSLGGEEETQTITTTNVTVKRKDIVMAAQTTDATATEVYLQDGSSVIDIDSSSTVKFKATFVATDGTDTAAFTQTGLVQNIGGTTSLIGTNITETLAQDSGNDWSAAITADDLNDYLKIVVTGEASTTIDWTVFLEISEAKR